MDLKSDRRWFSLFLALAVSAGSLAVVFDPAAAQQASSTASKTATPTPTPRVSEEDEIIKVDTEAVNVLFTAQDRNRRLLTDLKAEDVRILENGQPQEISAFSRQVDRSEERRVGKECRLWCM